MGDWALCHNPAVGHRWDPIDVVYVPNTRTVTFNDIANLRCGRCGVIKALLIGDVTHNRYKDYPAGYHYEPGEERPSTLDYHRMLIADVRDTRRKRQRARKPATARKTAARKKKSAA